MKKTNINYPHPVLNSSNEDYIDCSFNIIMSEDPYAEGKFIKIGLDYELISDGLKSHIDSHEAKVIIYVESVVAEYRKIFNFEEDSHHIDLSLDKNLLGKTVEIRGYIVARKTITPFKLKEHNEVLFGSVPFTINPGDILAVSEDFIKIPVEYYDPLADKPSIFAIRQQTDKPKNNVSVDYNNASGKIIIWLNSDTYKKYTDLYDAPETRTLLASFFAVPALVEVLTFMANMSDDNRDEYMGQKWYQVITNRMVELKVNFSDVDSYVNLADKILPGVFSGFIDTASHLFNEIHQGNEGE